MSAPIRVKDLPTAAQNYMMSGSRAADAYSRGVAKVTNWLDIAASDAAEANWSAGVTAAAMAKARARGLKLKVTSATWITDCQTKGAAVLGTRISGAGNKWLKGFTPYGNALSGLTLPAKVAADPIGNLTRRAGAVVKTLVNVKRAAEGLTPIA